MTAFPELPNIDKALALVEEIGKISQTDLSWELKRLRGYRDALFEHYAPFKAGDSVVLTRDIEITKDRSPGWSGCEDMMKKGATAVVHKIDWRKGWCIEVIFDHEFRWDSYAERYFERTGSKSIFMFGNAERQWAKVENITSMRLPG